MQSTDLVHILIREGCGSNILRLKFSEIVFCQETNFVPLREAMSDIEITSKIGQLGQILVQKIRRTVQESVLVRTRPKQIILDLGIGNRWSMEKERKIKDAIEEFFTIRGKGVSWSVQRKAGTQPVPC